MVNKPLNSIAFSLIIAIALFISSCGTDDNGDDGKVDIDNGILVLNEGGFQKGNSSLSFIDLDSNKVKSKLYAEANSKSLGDVGQSFLLLDDLIYVVLNNSQQIKILEAKTFIEKGIIEGFTSPRYMISVGNNRAYVSDLFANKISVVDLSNNAITSEIKLKGYTEKMALSGENVYVTNNATNYVYVIDILSDAITDSIDLGGKSDEIYALNNKVVVLRNANTDEKIKSAIVTIDPNTQTVSNTIEIESSATIWDGKSTQFNNSIYFIHDNAVMKYDGTTVSSLFALSSITVAHNIYVYNDKVYVTDARDFSSQGAVIQFDMNGNLLNTFETGIIPSQMQYIQL